MIAARHDARPHPIVERQPAVLDPIGEVDVRQSPRRAVGERRQRQVVRRDETEGPPLQQVEDDGRRPLLAIHRVGSLEYLVNEKEQGRLAACQLDHLP
jgi:hypothetical protein